MSVVIACDSFKGTLSSTEANEAIALAYRRVHSDGEARCVPLADGGEGTVQAIRAALGGELHQADVTNPLGRMIAAPFLMLPDKATAVLEMAAASGLTLIPPELRDPLQTTTYGTGQLISAALDAGARKIYIGVGGSVTVDGGCGAAQALGVRFCRADGAVLSASLAGGGLAAIDRVDVESRDSRIALTELEILCDVTNPLCGPNGAAAVFAPQKGAAPDMVARLERNLEHFATVIKGDLKVNLADMKHAGAAGGLAGGLHALGGAKLRSGIDTILELVRFDDYLEGADLVVTGEGCIDAQTTMGKVVAGVAAAAKRRGIKVIAFTGSIGPGADDALSLLDAYYEVTRGDSHGSSAVALQHTAETAFDR